MHKGFLIDLDGTIYLGDKVIPAGKRFVERLQNKKLPFLFVTNNSSRLQEDIVIMLANKFDIKVKAEQIYTSSLATRDYMDKLNKGKKVYIIGEKGLKNVILESGYIWDEEEPDYVIVGLDKELTYDKLSTATLAIQKGAYFIGTNPDKNIPTAEGLLPSAGPSLTYLTTATGIKPDIVGKPNAIMMDSAAELLGLAKDEIVMVGDNYETDIRAGIDNGIPSLLVLSGFTKKTDVPNLPVKPTYLVESLDEFEI